MKTFCVGDIHGAYKALVQVLERAEFDYENDTLITIGDIVDGWGDSFLVVEELLKIKNRIDIVGNHDDWFLTFIETGVNPDGWSQGGLATAKSYAKGIGMSLNIQATTINKVRFNKVTYLTNLISTDIPEEHVKFFKGQHRYYMDENKNVFVHGGFIRAFLVSETDRDYMMWDRKLFQSALSAESTKTKLKFFDDINKVFIGHTTTMHWDSMLPMKADRIWNLDTGAGGGGKLTVMNIDTEEYWQSDIVAELYPDDEHNDKFNRK